MTLTPSDVASLSSSLSRWEYAEYFSAVLVAIGCAGEYVADFTDLLTKGVKESKELLARVSTLLLIAALAFELRCLVRTNTLSGALIGSLDTLAEDAAGKAGKALDDSAAAIKQSGQATLEAGDAEDSASNAAGASARAKSSADAAGLAAGKAQAKVEVVSEREAKAEIELEKQKVKTAKAETARLQMQEAMAPRSAGTDGTQNGELLLFSGTKFFITFASDTDSQDLAANIAGILKRATWNPVGAEPYPFSPLTAQPPSIVGGIHLTITTSASLTDGVIVMAKPSSWNVPGRFSPKDEEAGNAAKLLCYTLKDSHVECDTFPRYPYWPTGVPDDAVWIVIGRKPAAYLKWASNPEVQQSFIEMEKKNQSNSEEDERSRAEILARRCTFLKQKPN